MRRVLLVSFAVVVVVLIVGDVVVRLVVQDQMAKAVKQNVSGVQSVSASISSFPFLGWLAVNGSVDKVSIRLEGVTTDQIDISQLRASAHGLHLDRGDLSHGKITVTRVSSVDVHAVLTDAELSRAAGVPVQVSPSAASVTIGGRTVHVQATVSGRKLRLGVAGISATVTLPSTDLLPCAPTAQLGDGTVTLSCTADHLPPIVVRAIGSVDLRNESGH